MSARCFFRSSFGVLPDIFSPRAGYSLRPMDVLRKLSDESSDDPRLLSRSPSEGADGGQGARRFDDLRAILTAHVHAQHLKASRITVLYVLAIAGGLCWVLTTWPAALPPGLHMLAVLAWPVGLLAAVFVGLLEWKWDTRLSRLTRR